MKIAIVFDKMIYGGVERVGINYIQLLKNNGHEVDVYILDKKTEGIIDEIEELTKIKFFSLTRFLIPDFYIKLVERHQYGKYILPFIYPTIMLFMNIKKCLFRFRGHGNSYDLAIAFSGHTNDLGFVAYDFLKTKKKLCWLHGALYQYLLSSHGYLKLYNKIRNLIVLVDDGEAEAKILNPTLKVNINKVYNPIKFKEANFNKDKVEKLRSEYGDFLLMVSRFLYPHKDQGTVIKAMAKVIHQSPNTRIIFLGDGPDLEKAKQLSEKLNISSNVFFLGSKGDVQNYYEACFAVVHASVAGEGLPTVILEAFLANKPVICTDSKVGPREIIKDNEFGLLTKVEDVEDMAEKILFLLENKKEYDKYSKKASERIKDFSEERISKKLLQVLESLW